MMTPRTQTEHQGRLELVERAARATEEVCVRVGWGEEGVGVGGHRRECIGGKFRLPCFIHCFQGFT